MSRWHVVLMWNAALDRKRRRSANRGLDMGPLLVLAERHFTDRQHHVVITGSTGVGTTYLASALESPTQRTVLPQ
jgi:DNA replication protein DnaC